MANVVNFKGKYKKVFKYRIVSILTLIFMLSGIISVKGEPIKDKEGKSIYINARYAIAMDAKTRRVLFEKSSYDLVPIASTTKIMTSLVALNYGNLKEKVVVSKKAATINGSEVGYKEGEEISIEELLYGLMFRSGNDAAIAIAEGIGGSVEGFCNLMNEYAYSIGALDSHFESPHGLDSANHYSTAYDLALITAKAKEIDKFNEIVGDKEVSAEEKGFTRAYNNINKILWQIPEANGVKTGYTGGAGKCLVTSVNIDGNDVIIVVLNSPTRWNETKKIYNNIKENYEFKEVAKKDEIMASMNINKRNKIDLLCSENIIVPLKKDENYVKNIVVKEDLNNLQIRKGEEIGKIIIEDEKGLLIYQKSLISSKNVNLSNKTKSKLRKLKEIFR